MNDIEAQVDTADVGNPSDDSFEHQASPPLSSTIPTTSHVTPTKFSLPLIPPTTGNDVYILPSSQTLLSESPKASPAGVKRTGRAPITASGTQSSSLSTPTAPGRLKVYKSASNRKWVPREIAALEFHLGIPMASERDIVHQGYLRQQELAIAQERHTAGPEFDDDNASVDELENPNSTPFPSSSAVSSLANFGVSHHGRWWEKWISGTSSHHPSRELSVSRGGGATSTRHTATRLEVEGEPLEQPGENTTQEVTVAAPELHPTSQQPTASSNKAVIPTPVVHAPGRRLEGDDATKVQIPLTYDSTVVTRQKKIARMATTREWELCVAHGLSASSKAGSKTLPLHLPMLDGRLFFSASESYPLQVFSLIRYEPKKEEAIRRRQKLEARGGGGTQFFMMPVRDWRGISYRALLPTHHHRPRKAGLDDSLLRFDRFATSANLIEHLDRRDERHSKDANVEDDLDLESDEEDAEDTYVAGLLDDPDMVQGRHRNVMIGDRASGPIVSSTIQFVKPKLLKADLNKQFRDRFDGWEPPKSQRQYIGAKVVDGIYTLMEPGLTGDDGTVGTAEDGSLQPTTTTAATGGSSTATPRKRQGSVSSMSTGGADANEIIRMPPSLTLSKIRSMKQQALVAAMKAKLEMSTVALAIVYFERLCLDCRVDKTNRRLSFAACLLLAIKINEAHVAVLMTKNDGEENSKNTAANRIQSLIRPTKKSNSMFASLLEFFTQEWEISLKHLFAAEWGVFAALQFRLHSKPSHVAFHFKRILKTIGKTPVSYLGAEVYGMWQEALVTEEYQRVEREARREARQKKQDEKKLMKMQMELDAANRREEEESIHLERQEEVPPPPSSVDKRKDELNKQASNGNIAAKRKSSSYLVPLGGSTDHSPAKKGNGSKHSRGIGGILNRFSGGKRALSSDKISQQIPMKDMSPERNAIFIPTSPSMPTLSHVLTTGKKDTADSFVIDIPDKNDDSILVGSDVHIASDEEGGIRF